jgi:diketogulonate reductase-like aldo/keto reductase
LVCRIQSQYRWIGSRSEFNHAGLFIVNFIECTQLIFIQTTTALECGFRHLDLAEIYGNDREIGVGLTSYLSMQSDVRRNNLWITSKLFVNMKDPSHGLQKIIERVQCDYLDLLLLHAPVEFALTKISDTPDIATIWRNMESLVATGLVRHIGVSNFRVKDIEELLTFATIKPFCNQIEWNPYLPQPQIVDCCKQNGILVTAYSPLGPLNLWPGGPLDEILQSLASKYNASTSSILLRYTQQKGILPITTSSKKDRLTEYVVTCIPSTGEFSMTLNSEEIELIESVGRQYSPKRKYWSAEFGADA